MIIGYIGPSSAMGRGNTLKEVLHAAGCSSVYEDSQGEHQGLNGLAQCLNSLRDGQDVLVVATLRNLGRSKSEVVRAISMLGQKGIALRSLEEHIDIDPGQSSQAYRLCVALDGLPSRRKTIARSSASPGRKGRPPKFDAEKQAQARELISEGRHSLKEISGILRVSPSTVYHFNQKLRASADPEGTADIQSPVESRKAIADRASSRARRSCNE